MPGRLRRLRLPLPVLASVLVSMLLLPLCPAPALAEKRVAWIVGIDTYTRFDPLQNPASDARLLADVLTRLGFTLVGGGPQINPTRERMTARMREFEAAAQGALALFFFSGHGSQFEGENYLIPADDQEIRVRDDLPFNSLPLNSILNRVRGAETLIVLLDACRNNPLPTRDGNRDGTKGLARMKAPRNSVVVFATQPGDTAADGSGSNSPFTMALREKLNKPGEEFTLLMREVRDRVGDLTNGNQNPEMVVNLNSKKIYLVPAALPAEPTTREVVAPPPQPDPDAILQAAREKENAVWSIVSKTPSLPSVVEFIRTYCPAGDRCAEAEKLRGSLAAAAAAAANRPASPPAEPKPAPVRETPASARQPTFSQAEAMNEWTSSIQFAKRSQTVVDFLRKYPSGPHVALAKERLSELQAAGK